MADLLNQLAMRSIRAGLRVPAYGNIQKLMDNHALILLLRRLGVDCVLDVGANVGQFATRLRLMGYAGHIVSFEPIPADFATLARKAQGDDKWHTFNLALGAGEEIKQFNVLGSTVYSSFLQPRTGATPEIAEKIAVQVKRLDAMIGEIDALAGNNTRYFLKMDTQGFDPEVFEGASGCIGRMAGLLSEISVEQIYEGQPSYTATLDAYQAAGFSLMDLAIVNRTPCGSVLEYDCLMARKHLLDSVGKIA